MNLLNYKILKPKKFSRAKETMIVGQRLRDCLRYGKSMAVTYMQNNRSLPSLLKRTPSANEWQLNYVKPSLKNGTDVF